MAKSFRELRARMSLDAQARAAQQAHAMRDIPTPGQIAYEGYMRVHFGTGQAVAWGYAMLEPHERDAWEAAAQAVRAQCTPQEDTP
jgi:hypothetical protein